MNRVICEKYECTGCAACRDACPKQCISMCCDELDATYPIIDNSLCVDCGICINTCPNNRAIKWRITQKVYAAWSNDTNVRNTSASGGIAYELYHFWIKRGGVAAGVIYEREEGCHFILIENEDDILATKNSKYTFSDTAGIYRVVREKLDSGVPVLFVGAPCQIAGLFGYLKKDYDKLMTVDIICHGMPPSAYLEQHVSQIEKKKRTYTKELFFRDPKYGTHTFTFSLNSINGKNFYRKKVLTTDNFQLGYHHALIYRENCYQCHYARKERISDLTIGDFTGLGRCAPFNQGRRNVSCILQNTDKGRNLLNSLSDVIYREERPIGEAFDFEKQLKTPSVKHSRRNDFETVYKETKNYTMASDIALRREKLLALYQSMSNNIRKIAYEILVFLHIKGKPNGR